MKPTTYVPGGARVPRSQFRVHNFPNVIADSRFVPEQILRGKKLCAQTLQQFETAAWVPQLEGILRI